MMNRIALLYCTVVLTFGAGLLSTVGVLNAQDAEPGLARVLISPPYVADEYRSVREMFRDPDQWKRCREYADGISLGGAQLNKSFSDDDLKNMFDGLKSMNMTFDLEVWAVKKFEPVGSKQFRSHKKWFDRFIACGGKIHAIAIDEPLNGTEKVEQDLAYAVKETADFIELVRKEYPEILIGDIEAYPHFDADTLIDWIDALQAELKKRKVRELDFFRLDINWSIFGKEMKGRPLSRHPDAGPRTGSWEDVLRIERHCKSIGLPVSIIFWAANHGTLKRVDLVDEKTWYLGVMRMGDDYFSHRSAGANQFVYQSWITVPSEILPETKPYTFTHSFLEFAGKFLKNKRSNRQ